MSAIPFVLVGLVLGAALTLWWLHRWSLSGEGQRIVARMDAERRIQDVETRALRAMAATAEQAIHGTTHPVAWPSQNAAVDSTAVEITTKEN